MHFGSTSAEHHSSACNGWGFPQLHSFSKCLARDDNISFLRCMPLWRAAPLHRVQPGSSPAWKQRCSEERDLLRTVEKADSKARTSVFPIWLRSNLSVGC